MYPKRKRKYRGGNESGKRGTSGKYILKNNNKKTERVKGKDTEKVTRELLGWLDG